MRKMNKEDKKGRKSELQEKNEKKDVIYKKSFTLIILTTKF